MMGNENLTEVRKKFFGLSEGNAAECFFEENYTELRYTVVGYAFLKEIYERPEHRLEHDRYFQYVFGAFYAMNRVFVSARFIRRFYKKMDEFKSRKRTAVFDAAKIAKELSRGERSFQFSFVTKMLNLVNDTLYPIYDSKVALVFGFGNTVTGDDDAKAEQYRERYQAIIDTYLDLLNDNRTAELLNLFRDIFKCPELSDMRILDLIFWEMGKQEEKKIADQKKLSRVETVLNSDQYKGTKIRELMKLGLNRREILDLEFVDPAYVYDIFGEKKKEDDERKSHRKSAVNNLSADSHGAISRGSRLRPEDLYAVFYGSDDLTIFIRREDLNDTEHCLALKLVRGIGYVNLLQRFLKFGAYEYVDVDNDNLQRKYIRKLYDTNSGYESIMLSFAIEVDRWKQLQNKFDYKPENK